MSIIFENVSKMIDKKDFTLLFLLKTRILVLETINYKCYNEKNINTGGINMKILIICSKAFYKDIAPIKEKLEQNGHVVELPNSYYEPDAEKKSWALGEEAHSEFKARMFRMSEERIATMDAVLTLNFDKNGKKNYIGGATFIEIYEAFMKNKKIYLSLIKTIHRHAHSE